MRARLADPDSFEHDAAAAWCEGPRRAVAALGPAAGPAAGLGIAACVPSLVALGDHLEPLSPGLLYGDWRGRAAAAAWPPASPLDIREGEAFLHWAAKHWPGARAYWPAQALAAVALGGEPVIDSFTAMSYFPVFDGRRWDPAELSRIGITEDQLPIVVTETGVPALRIAAGMAHQPADRPASRNGQQPDGRGEPAGGARAEHDIAEPGFPGAHPGAHPGSSGRWPGCVHRARARQGRRDDGADNRRGVTARRGAHHVRHDAAHLGRDAR